jgi:hypothetical protein
MSPVFASAATGIVWVRFRSGRHTDESGVAVFFEGIFFRASATLPEFMGTEQDFSS